MPKQSSKIVNAAIDGRIRAGAALLALVFVVLPVRAQTEPATSMPANASVSTGQTASRNASASRPRPSGIDNRVQLLTAELKLDAAQQTKVRGILEDQRRQTLHAWNDSSVPSAVRVQATQQIGEQAAERIRTILNDEQRANYLKARPSLPDQAQSPEKIDSWINAVGSH